MQVLEEFEQKIFLADSMFIETGGKLGKDGLDNYLDACMAVADKYYRDTQDKNELMKIIEFYIEQYKDQVLWKYYHYEMQFLNTLKIRVEQL